MDTITPPQIGEILEQGGQTAANTVKSAVSDSVQRAAVQIGIKNEPGGGQNQATKPEPSAGVLREGDSITNEMVSDYYAPSSANNTPSAQSQEEYETQERLKKVREALQAQHDEVYFGPLVAALEQGKKEQRPAEVAEKEEEQKKMAELEQNKKELPPLAVQRGKIHMEANPGVAG